jgi:hypothetical protein
MHFHLPKPLHGWREFGGEVGIIVVGVLIALAAEQVVEDRHWSDRVREAEASMIKELGEDDGAQAVGRIAVAPCIARQLQSAEQALLAERDHGTPFVAPKLNTPPFRTWDNDAWRAAVSSDATSHMATERMYNWSSPYALTADMDQGAVREFNDWADLERIGTLPPHPSDPERDRMLAAIARARQDNQFLAWMSDKFLEYAGIAGVRVPDAQKQRQIALLQSSIPAC